ncbi:hypothetical protein [Leptospira sp. GIMC2001]|uniref:hypothetical protein n=1 Tax=Leptospira sp. GIMC2001 TaxID=1513297 RepID=UPI00234B42E4|nr:hypothetical protein [Leptospira sp. GIMC2001]WCL48314.1 hypothetical protein O4O04_13490 [Leptospira sp. GIMC2001]
MEKHKQNHLITALVGFCLACFFAFMSYETPSYPVIENHNGFSSTLIAMEFASVPSDIYGIIGGPENEEYMDYIDRFKTLLLYDLVLIVLYVVFYMQLIGFLYRNSASHLPTYIVSLLIAFAAVFDLAENFQIQSILDSPSADKMEEPLAYLAFLAYPKWILIFSVNAWIGMRIWLDEKGVLLKAIAIFLFTSFMFFIASFIKSNLIELGILFIILGLGFFWIYSLLIIVLSRKI